jgi:polyphosphate glucokinase
MTGEDETGKPTEPAEPEPAAGPAEAVAVALDASVVKAAARTAKPATRRNATARSTPRRAPAPAARSGPAAPVAPAVVPPLRPTTLAIDVGGTGLKASVLDAAGKLVADRVRVPTHYPCAPRDFVNTLTSLVAPLPDFDRVSVGFNGVVRKGVILTAPHFVTRSGAPGAPIVTKLLDAWTGFDLAAALQASFGRPVRIANDADLQGLEVVSGSGLELVVTLGTGVGTGLFLDGKLMPHLELSHHPFRKDQTYDQQLGDGALRRIGVRKWRKRIDEGFANFHRLLNYDRLYVGGGNSRLLVGYLDPSVTIVDNVAGILGGIKLWELPSPEASD